MAHGKLLSGAHLNQVSRVRVPPVQHTLHGSAEGKDGVLSLGSALYESGMVANSLDGSERRASKP